MARMPQEKVKVDEDVLRDKYRASHIIDKCEICGFVSYCPITACPTCGNKIIVAERMVNGSAWMRGAVKEILKQEGSK
jgi:uncharacterized OB-fold protein